MGPKHDRPRPIRVLVVDDSALLRRALGETFAAAAGFSVVGEAATGASAIERTAALRPDLITMDLAMPDMDGLTAIERIMAEHPTPILVVTGEPRYRGLDASFEALTRGAIELVAKPSGFPVAGAELHALLDAARMAASIAVVPHVRASARRRSRGTQPGNAPSEAAAPLARVGGCAAGGVVVVGASTGGPGALRDLLRALPAEPRVPIVIVQHMAEAFGEGFVRWLASCVPWNTDEARPGDRLRAGHVYVAARGPHLRIGLGATLTSGRTASSSLHCPSIDELFHSAAEVYGSRAMGVLLTGMGADGAVGLAAIAAAGGMTAAQDEASCTVFGMPRAAIELGAARISASPVRLARLIHEASEGGSDVQ